MKEIYTNCSLCSLACPLILKGGERQPIFTGEALLTVEWDTRPDSKFGGSLCARGNGIAGLVSHPKRLNYPFVMGERTRIEAAVKEVAKNLEQVKKEFGAKSIGIILGENLTNEEAATAVEFAERVIGSSNVALFAPDDAQLARGYLEYDMSGVKAPSGGPKGKNEAIFVVGDPFTEHPCVAKDLIKRRNAARGNEFIVVSPEVNHTAWFATMHLRCRPGGEAAVAAGIAKGIVSLSGASVPDEVSRFLGGIDWGDVESIGGVKKEEISNAARKIAEAAAVKTYISNIFARIGAPALTTAFAELATRSCAGEWEFNPQFVQQNTFGIYKELAGTSSGASIENILTDDVKGLIVLGVDLFSSYPAQIVENALRSKKFLATTQQFWNQTAERANVVIPAANLIEKSGTVSIAVDEDLVRKDTVAPPGGAISEGEFLTLVASEMGHELTQTEVSRGEAKRSGTCRGIAEEWKDYCSGMSALASAKTILIPWSEAVHVADGAISRHLHWSDITCPEPELMVSREIAKGLNITDGAMVTVSSAAGEVTLRAQTSGKLEGGVVAATIHFPSVRKLFPWNFDKQRGEVVFAPVSVELKVKEAG